MSWRLPAACCLLPSALVLSLCSPATSEQLAIPGRVFAFLYLHFLNIFLLLPGNSPYHIASFHQATTVPLVEMGLSTHSSSKHLGFLWVPLWSCQHSTLSFPLSQILVQSVVNDFLRLSSDLPKNRCSAYVYYKHNGK